MEEDDDRLPLNPNRPDATKYAIYEFVEKLKRYPTLGTLEFPDTSLHWEHLKNLRIWTFTAEATYFHSWSDIHGDLAHAEKHLGETIDLLEGGTSILIPK